MKPATLDSQAVFDLSAVARELRSDPAYDRTGHVARTLIRVSDLRVVLLVLRDGAHIAEHRTDETAAIQVRGGRLRLRVAGRPTELGPGELLVLERGAPHDVTALGDAELLLTIGWHGDAR